MNNQHYFLIILLAIIFYSCQSGNTGNIESFKPSLKKDIIPEAMIFLESKVVEGEWDTIKNPVKKKIEIKDENLDRTIGGLILDPFYELVLEQNLAPNQDSMISKAGDEIHYIITITNEGDFPSGKYKVENIIPAGLGFLNADNKAEEYGGIISWNSLRELKPGEVLELKYSLSVDPMPIVRTRNFEDIEEDAIKDYGEEPFN